MFVHKSVLAEETISSLNIMENGIYIDATCGGGGHSYEILRKLGKNGLLICLDRDPAAIKATSERLSEFANKVILQRTFCDIADVLRELNIAAVDGILMDLGVSSHQLDTPERGFSYHSDAKLDMRMSQEGISAYDIVNSYSETELAKILFTYGEEKYARSIAANIVKKREISPIETTLELSEIISNSVPFSAKRDKNPAKKTFQALRIEVNSEFSQIQNGIDLGFKKLKPKGRFAVITFHSLEDRIIKQKFAEFCTGCICPKEFPVCVCKKTPSAALLNKKPIIPSKTELEENSRSHSAKLRVLVKL